ncbi:MAG: 60S ribosome biogenesis [Lasallia pustulata]|uniref:60S ribosome biogenesis n=1 Tax=Lasallia pustulata TaxID=136370 RepID=A0A5M8Q279_9LECA|nr:MAG: 60S ribosome biogenesis [Lasallia pustulata]
MAKRKREAEESASQTNGLHKRLSSASKAATISTSESDARTTVQIITGSYERVLHGVTATVSHETSKDFDDGSKAEFADTFLFNAHGSAIKCLALSPQSTSSDASQEQKIILASGSTDERINLYHISASPPSQLGKITSIPSLAGNTITENPRNRELGSLLHHSASINALYFPTRSKLLSAGEDNTIAVTRTRDWTVLSTIKAPIPKAMGRPSGDTAPSGGTPAGVNDFAVHPSLKLMVSVGKGEKCMRLWNLVTGKKAGVLTFGRELLQDVGEGRWSSGEGRKVEWDSKGEEFAVAFERGVVVFGMDSKPRCRILASSRTKVHQLRYFPLTETESITSDILALSTEDGRVLFYTTHSIGILKDKQPEGEQTIPSCAALGQLGGPATGVKGRIKDFEILRLPSLKGRAESTLIVTGSSDGALRLWTLNSEELNSGRPNSNGEPSTGNVNAASSSNIKTDGSNTGASTRQVGHLIGSYETGNRITCLTAFVMSRPSVVDGLVQIDGGDIDTGKTEDGSDESHSS